MSAVDRRETARPHRQRCRPPESTGESMSDRWRRPADRPPARREAVCTAMPKPPQLLGRRAAELAQTAEHDDASHAGLQRAPIHATQTRNGGNSTAVETTMPGT